jgi:hypothetical protein
MDLRFQHVRFLGYEFLDFDDPYEQPECGGVRDWYEKLNFTSLFAWILLACRVQINSTLDGGVWLAVSGWRWILQTYRRSTM